MVRSGLVSVTFRNLAPQEIVNLVASARLQGIEWGGDVHVPHGDLSRAREVRRMTEEAGLAVAAYGSYYRVGHETPGTFDAVLSTAVELGAPTIRVWAGKQGSASATEEYFEMIVNESRRIAEMAEPAGIAVAFEFHRKTLTDTNASAVRLLRAVGHANIRTYWQPPLGASPEECLAGLGAVLPWLSNLHVFHWTASGERRPLAEGRELWRSVLTRICGSSRNHFAMIEFVENDSPESFMRDAATLDEWIREITSPCAGSQ